MCDGFPPHQTELCVVVPHPGDLIAHQQIALVRSTWKTHL